MYTLKAVKRLLPMLLVSLLLLAAFAAQAGDIKAGYLGVMLQDLSPGMTKALGLDDETGVLVDNVLEDSPAAKAGLAEGDVIIQINDTEISDNRALTKTIRSSTPGDKVKVVVLRGGERKTIKVELGEREETKFVTFYGDNGQAKKFEDHDSIGLWVEADGNDEHKIHLKHLMDGEDNLVFFDESDRGFMGIVPDDLDAQLGEYFGVKDGQGVLVTSVTDDSGAEQAGLKAGDVITHLGDTEIDDTDAMHDAMSGTASGDEIEVKVLRKGKKKSFKVTLGEMPLEDLLQKQPGLDNNFRLHKTMRHAAPHAQYKVMRKHGTPHSDIELEIIRESSEDFMEMKAELRTMQKELQELKKELKK